MVPAHSLEAPVSRALLIAAALLGMTVVAQAGGIVVPAEERYSAFHADLPACDNAGVLGTISSRFAGKESTFWNSSLGIDSFDKVHEIGFRANGLGYIPRRYCVAHARMNDNRERTVIYQIQDRLGWIGIGYGVEWCVIGKDHNFAYAPACSALRPFADRYLGESVLHARY